MGPLKCKKLEKWEIQDWYPKKNGLNRHLRNDDVNSFTTMFFYNSFIDYNNLLQKVVYLLCTSLQDFPRRGGYGRKEIERREGRVDERG